MHEQTRRFSRSSSAGIWSSDSKLTQIFASHVVTMAEPELSSAANPSLRSPRSGPLSLSFPFLREGSRVWERAALQPGETVRANAGPVFKGMCKNFSRSQGHGYIRPAHGGEDIFVHISDIEGEYVPVEGDEVTYKVCPIPPKNVKVQAVEVIITHLKPGTKHETWSGQIISS
ncbi:Cold shock domain-containing protein C2 [Labeo rohita]|uniref:Cold shock domain-containing protein C2 n=1 Tax=Labeo rohita TaxID=84645 RepID=A0ABQ8MVN9_LABRO|nr:Cold shock domain-containing protein C2 [Labeo rohita]